MDGRWDAESTLDTIHFKTATVYGSVSSFLTLVRVSSLLFCRAELPIHVYPRLCSGQN